MKLVTSSEFTRHFSSDLALRVRVFSAKGLYPKGVLATERGLYVATEDIVFTVVEGKPYDQVESKFPYSEMAWASPQEVRFWSSIILCEDGDGPKILFYPKHIEAGVLQSKDIDLRDTSNQMLITSLVREGIGPEENFDRGQFSIFDTEVNLERQPEFYSRISETDHILLRGMTCLIKCDMLSRYHEFAEEATIVAFIALDASFALVSSLLRKSGISNPSASDAGKWLDDTFNRPMGIDPGERRYFEEIYEQRILTMHPGSRFGECPFAPLMLDDLFDLRRDLREIFAYLVTGMHGPEFERRRSARASW